MKRISIASLEVFKDRMLQMQDDISLSNFRYARYLSKEVSRCVVRYIREVYKVDEDNALIAGRFTLGNQQIMDYLAENGDSEERRRGNCSAQVRSFSEDS